MFDSYETVTACKPTFKTKIFMDASLKKHRYQQNVKKCTTYSMCKERRVKTPPPFYRLLNLHKFDVPRCYLQTEVVIVYYNIIQLYA